MQCSENCYFSKICSNAENSCLFCIFFNFELYLKSLSFFLLENFCQENKQIVLVLEDKFVQVPPQVHISFQIFEINQLW